MAKACKNRYNEMMIKDNFFKIKLLCLNHIAVSRSRLHFKVYTECQNHFLDIFWKSWYRVENVAIEHNLNLMLESSNRVFSIFKVDKNAKKLHFLS